MSMPQPKPRWAREGREHDSSLAGSSWVLSLRLHAYAPWLEMRQVLTREPWARTKTWGAVQSVQCACLQTDFEEPTKWPRSALRCLALFVKALDFLTAPYVRALNVKALARFSPPLPRRE